MRADELASLASRPPEAIENRQVFPPEDPDALVRAVDEVEQALRRIARELQAEAASRPASFGTHEPFHQVFAGLTKHLDAIAAPIRHVDEAVLRTDETVQG